MALYPADPSGLQNPFSPGLPLTQNLDAFFTRLGIGPSAAVNQQPAVQRTIINDLDEIFADLSSDQKRAIETNEDYNVALGALLQKFLFYLLSRTPDGTAFVLGPGKKSAENVLDVTKKLVAQLDVIVKDEFKTMNDRIQQLEQVIQQQMSVNQAQATKIQEQEQKLEAFKTSLGGD